MQLRLGLLLAPPVRRRLRLRVRHRLAQLLLQAAMAVCPQEVSLLNHKKNGVRRAQSTGQVGDYSTSFARAAFLRMLGTRRQQRRTQQSSGAGAPGEGDAADDEGEVRAWELPEFKRAGLLGAASGDACETK